MMDMAKRADVFVIFCVRCEVSDGETSGDGYFFGWEGDVQYRS